MATTPTHPHSRITPNLPNKIIPTKIAWLKLSGKPPMDMRIPPLELKILIESSPPKSRILVRRLAVFRMHLIRSRGWQEGIGKEPDEKERARVYDNNDNATNDNDNDNNNNNGNINNTNATNDNIDNDNSHICNEQVRS